LTGADIAVNLTDPMYRGEYHGKARHSSDLDQVVTRAREAGVERILITGTSIKETRDALELAKKYSMSKAVGQPDGQIYTVLLDAILLLRVRLRLMREAEMRTWQI
jgi:Tat protein secretion system quality control protein TatD with DNase activity